MILGSNQKRIKHKFTTPTPNVYYANMAEGYLETVKVVTMGVKLSDLWIYSTPASNIYRPQEC